MFVIEVNTWLPFVSILDPLSSRMLWLLLGVILSRIAGSFTRSIKLLWVTLLVILLLSFGCLNFFFFYILFEFRLIPILLIILSQGTQPERLSAGAYLLFYTTAISIPYLTVLLVLTPISLFFFMNSHFYSMGFMRLLFLSPFLVKMPIIGVHFWLPKAHVEANTAGSIVLAGLLLKLGRYGAARTTILVKTRISAGYLSSLFVLLTLIASLITCFQTDLKKIVAYRRVTHITFMLLALFSRRKVIIVSVVLVSLSHGWVSIGIFSYAGILSHSYFSRMGVVVGAETIFHWSMLVLGFILISNASIPPIPSFFPELLIVIRRLSMRGVNTILFVFLSLTICYYNAYFFLWVSHYKPVLVKASSSKFIERLVLSFLLLITLQSLHWLQFF